MRLRSKRISADNVLCLETGDATRLNGVLFSLRYICCRPSCPVLEPVCASPANAAARPKLGIAAVVQLGTATAEMSLYRSVRFILHPRVFVPQKFRLRPASDSGIKAVIRLNGFRFRGEPPKCGKNALQIAESHTAEAGTAMAPRRRAAGAVFMLLTVGGLMLNNTPLLQNSPASS